MSIDPFPERVVPRKWCDRNGTINSSIPLGKLLRLSEYLDDDHGQVEVRLDFDRDAGGICCLTGNINARVNMQCQRCLETTTVDLASELAIKVAGSDREAGKIADYVADPLDKLEIVVCEDGELDLLSVIEDELIMSLPIVAAHDNDQCNKRLGKLNREAKDLDIHSKSTQSNIMGLDVLEQLKQELKQQDGNKAGDTNNLKDD